MKRSIFLCAIALFPILSWTQTVSVRFEGAITNLDASKKEMGVNVAIVQNNQKISNANTDAKGKYVLKGTVDVAQPFDVVFSKNGMVSKKINFDLKGIQTENLPKGDFAPVDALNLDLFAQRDGVNFAFLQNEPVGKFVWDTKTAGLKLDENARKITADKINKLLQEAHEQQKYEIAYNEAIKNAEKAYAEKKYQQALELFEKAVLIPGKGKEKYPNDKIIEISGLIQKQKEQQLQSEQQNNAYTNLIKAADNFRNDGELEKAKQKYTEATQLKKEEKYPKEQITWIDQQLAKQQTETQYNALISEADKFDQQSQYDNAIEKYRQASKLKPNESYPKGKVTELELKIKNEQKVASNKQQYDQFVQQGDKFVQEQKWTEAQKAYQQAATIDKTPYVQGKLQDVAKNIITDKTEKDRQAKINQLVQAGDDAQKQKQWTVAIVRYKEALAHDPNNASITQKITDVEQKTAQETQTKNVENQFRALIKLADNAMSAKKYQEAIDQYDQAIALKEDQSAKKKREQAQIELQKTTQNKERESEFNQRINEGKTASIEKNYPLAIEKYRQALVLKPNDPPTIKKINDINKLIAQQQSVEAKQQAQQEREQKIAKLLQEGNELMEGTAIDGPQMNRAKEKFQSVLAIDNKNSVAIQRIAYIDKLINSQKEGEQKTAQFTQFVTQGDQKQSEEKWVEAIQFYDQALKIKTEAGVLSKKTFAQQKIVEQKAQNQLKSDYLTAVQVADQLRDAQKYMDAIARYEVAKTIDPQQSYPQTEIEKINDLLAQKKVEEATNKQITQILYRAKVAFDQKKYNESIALYHEALAINPNHAKAKLELELAEAEKTKQEIQIQQLDQFNQLKAQGIAQANNKQWNAAIQSFEDALKLKKEAEVTRRLADAHQAMSDEEQAKIVDEQYQALMQQARQAEVQQSYDEAIEKYQKACELKPSKQLLNKIYEVRADYQALKVQWEIDDRYTKFMAKGDWMNDNEEYPQAINNYKDALDTKPGQPEAQKKLEEVRQKMALKKQKEEDAAIQQIVAEVDKLVADKNFYEARQNVQKALKIRPKNPEIIAIYKHIEKTERDTYSFAEYMERASALASLRNYPEALNFYQKASDIYPDRVDVKEKIQGIQQLWDEQKHEAEQHKLHNQYYVIAQQHQARGEYQQALENYKNALGILPNDMLTQQKITEVELRIAKNEADRKQREEEDLAFNQLVQQADLHYNNKNYQESIELLRQAVNERPEHVYARTKLAEVDRIYRVEAKEQFDQQHKQIVTNADNAYKSRTYEVALDLYQQAVQLKPEDIYSQAKIKELNGILHPTIDVSAELQDLGEPFEGSMFDGQLALIRAEEQREDNKRSKIEHANQQVDLSNNELAVNKQKELETRVQSLYDVYAYLIENQHVRTSDKLTSFATFQEKTQQQLERYVASSNEQTQSTFDTQSQINDQNQKVNTIFDGNEMIPVDHHASIDIVRTQNEENDRKKTEIKRFENRIRDGGLTLLKNQQRDIETMTTEEQKNVADRVDGMRVTALEQIDHQTTQNYYDVLTTKQQSQQVQSQIEDSKRVEIDQSEQSESINTVRIKEDDITIDRTQLKRNEIESVDNNLSEMLKIKDEKEYADATNQGRIERIVLAKEVANTRRQLEDLSVTLADQNQRKAMANREHAEHVNFTLEEIGNANVEALAENNQKFREREQTLLAKQQYEMDKNYQESVDAEVKMREIRNKITEDQLLAEAKLIPTIQNVETIKSEVTSSQEQTVQRFATKNSDTKIVLEQQEIKKQQLENEAVIALNEKTESVKTAVSDAINTHEMIGSATYDDRIAVQKQMNIEKDGTTTKYSQKENESRQKSEDMKEVSKALSIDNVAKETEKTNVIHATRTEIDKAMNYTAQTTYVPNSLGEKYPEGVSQEMFQRKDEAGVLVAIVTRRIVVIQGRGTEYVCTRTNHATTYSKNGNPITEYIWQKETQDASLQRHY